MMKIVFLFIFIMTSDSTFCRPAFYNIQKAYCGNDEVMKLNKEQVLFDLKNFTLVSSYRAMDGRRVNDTYTFTQLGGEIKKELFKLLGEANYEFSEHSLYGKSDTPYIEIIDNFELSFDLDSESNEFRVFNSGRCNGKTLLLQFDGKVWLN